MILPPELWICIALHSPRSSSCDEHDEHDEYTFNSLARAVPILGRWTIGARSGGYDVSAIINRRLDLMEMFGYSVKFNVGLPTSNQYMSWKKNGKTHRNDVPACVWDGGDVNQWKKHGKLHRIDGPAETLGNGDFRWKRHRRMHRDDGPAELYSHHGILIWHQHGVANRADGPAYIDSYGEMTWYINDRAHRDHGPAFIHANGVCEFFINGVRV